jgi:LysM repeat protein
MGLVHELLAELPWTNRRIILARDWITDNRETTNDLGEFDGGVAAINKQFGGTAFTAGEIGNVEHFYVSAVLGMLLPHNPLWLYTVSSASLFWEAVVGPARIAFLKRGLPAKELMDAVLRNLSHNLRQFRNADFAGLRFGEVYDLGETIEALQNRFGTTPPAPPPAAPPATPGGPLPTVMVAAGDSLSLIAQRKYNDVLLWPVIYDANLDVIGPNPNKTKVGQVLVIPSIAGMTAAQRDAYHVRGRAWRSYN